MDNVVAKVTKAEIAQKSRSDVEFEPALKVAEAPAKAEDAQKWPSAGNVVAKVTKAETAQNTRSDVEFEPALKVAEAIAKAEDAQKWSSARNVNLQSLYSSLLVSPF